MKRAEKAFTLVELLVVISIIALLLAILMPALAKVKEQGRTVVCATNLKNYGLAVGMYANANNDSFPDKYWLYSYATLNQTMKGAAKGGGNTVIICPSGCRWHYSKEAPDGSLWPYLRDKNINICPTFRNFAMAGGIAICPYPPHSDALAKAYDPSYSYVWNLSLCWVNKWSNPPNYAPVKTSSVKRASMCVAFSEANLWTIGSKTSSECDQYNHPARAGDGGKTYSSTRLGNTDLDLNADKFNLPGGRDNIATYHKVSTGKCDEGVANIVYVDGHVKARRGLAGFDAYFEYGRPYDGHEKIARW